MYELFSHYFELWSRSKSFLSFSYFFFWGGGKLPLIFISQTCPKYQSHNFSMTSTSVLTCELEFINWVQFKKSHQGGWHVRHKVKEVKMCGHVECIGKIGNSSEI